MIITFGILAAFFVLVIGVLQYTFKQDKDFTEYAVGGRSFGGYYQAMSFLNTWYPGAIFIAFAGLAVSSGVIGFYLLSYSLLTIVLMYLMARRVWMWGKAFDLRTQPDLFSLRYDSHHIRALAGVIGIVSSFPWLVLGMQALGTLFQYMSLQSMSFTTSVILGVVVLVIRQFWTIRMGMRGVVISDMVQGIAAYIGGTFIVIGLLGWLVGTKGIGFSSIDPKLFEIPSLGSESGPLYLFALVFTGTVGGWCWPNIFVRLFTADGVRSVKQAAALAIPLSFVFCVLFLVFCILATALPEVAAKPDDVWFIACQQAGGLVLLAFAGVVVFAATVGNVDGTIQAAGAQIGNDLIGNYMKLSHKQLVLASKIGMLIITILAAWVACSKLPALFMLAVIAYQGIIQLAVPQFLGVFWKRGNKTGAIAGMVVGFITAVVLEMNYPGSIPALGGLTSGIVALVVNFAIYMACAYLLPQSEDEKRRVEHLFAMTRVGAATLPEAEAMPAGTEVVKG
jgi:SSS family solute:Na+ symporter